MKSSSVLRSFTLALALATGLVAANKPSDPSDPKQTAKPTDAAAIAQARASYPLKTCLVSGEALGSMGEALGYVHRAAGQPDRVIFFCCAGCTDDFKAEPAKFLAKLDAAAKAKK